MRLFPLPAAALLLAAASRAAPGAASTPEPSTPSAHLAAGQRLYQKLDLDAALAELQQAEVAAKDNDDDMTQVLIYRGLIYSETGKTAAANDQFKRALAIRPWAEVPADTSPRIARMFSDARKSIWGLASVKPPPKRPSSAQPAMPASPSGQPAAAQPAAAQPAAAQPAATQPANPASPPANPAPATPAPQPSAPDSPPPAK